MSRSKSVALGVVSSQVFAIATMLIGIVTTPIVLRFLSKETYGLWIVLTQTVGYLGMLDFGLSAGVERFLAMNRQSEDATTLNRIVSTGFYMYLGLGALVIMIAFGLSPFIPRLLGLRGVDTKLAWSLFVTLGVWSGAQFPMRAIAGLFFAHQRQSLGNVLAFIFANSSLAVSVLLLYLGHGLWSFVYAGVGTTVLNICTIIYFVRRFYPKLKIARIYLDQTILRQMYHYGFFLFLTGIGWTIVSSTDRVMIGSLISLSAVTTFSLTVRMPEIAGMLVFRITDNAFPVMVEVSAHEDVAKFRKIHQKLMVTTVSLAAIAFWMILILNKYFLQLWVGAEFYAGDKVLLTACVLMAYHSCLHVSAMCLNGAGHVKGFSMSAIVEAVLNLALSIWLGRSFGVIGVIGATLIAGMLTSGWYTPRLAMRYMQIPFREYILAPILRPLAAISAVGFMLYLLSRIVFGAHTVNWGTLVGFGAPSGVVLAAFAWFVVLKKELEAYVPIRLQKILGIAG